MREAVEIAKLRLFLKLVATVDVNPRKENFGLEPLPDIDFNIRAGNTLVGFATEKELFETIQKKDGLFAQAVLDDFKEESALVSKAYQHFQDSQLISDKGSDSFKQAKADLNQRLNALNHKLNVYLAINYGIDAQLKPTAFEAWLTSHQPFHWFAEFYRIVAANGGFDVTIGNPPYVVYSNETFPYKLNGFKTLDCKDLYAFVIERASIILSTKGAIGMIVPISIISTDGFASLRNLLSKTSDSEWYSSYSMRPAKLFEGVEKRLTIFIVNRSGQKQLHSTKYHKWYAENRESLFSLIQYASISSKLFQNDSIPKVSSEFETSIIEKIITNKSICRYTVNSR